MCMHVLCSCSAMEVLSFLLCLGLMFQIVSARPTTDPTEADALNKIIDYWNLRGKLNITSDPCSQNAKWANQDSNPRVACDCGGNTCFITHL
uniref:Uncharacterized protein n=1 Tax=Rhizophora mucronata TaxID=61149 RepID=A0A2P2QWL4_RHIMU